MNKLIAIVGMAGSGKSEAARIFSENGYKIIRFGDLTEIEIKKRGLILNEQNERMVRENLRKEHGMAAFAILNLQRIEEALNNSNVAVDGMYSFEEFLVLNEHFRDRLNVVAIYASPKTRIERLKHRVIRPLTAKELHERDYSEIKNLNKGGPIAIANQTIINEGSLNDLQSEVELLIQN